MTRWKEGGHDNLATAVNLFLHLLMDDADKSPGWLSYVVKDGLGNRLCTGARTMPSPGSTHLFVDTLKKRLLEENPRAARIEVSTEPRVRRRG